MRPDTFARLVTLETLIDAEVGYWLEAHPESRERFVETLVARIGDLVDEIDALDAVAAARVYDAVVDFLADFPAGDDEGAVEAALRFKRAVDRLIERAMQPRDLDEGPTWAVVLDELLEELAAEYARAVRAEGEVDRRGWLRARHLLAAAREAAERLARGLRGERRAELRDGVDRLAFAVGRRLPPAALEPLVRAPQRLARRQQPSGITSIGAFVVGQLLRRRTAEPRQPRSGE